jgi:O-antigen ligase
MQRQSLGLDFKIFVGYLIFVFLNPHNLLPAMKVVRPALLISGLAMVLQLTYGRGRGALGYPQSKMMITLVFLSLIATCFSIDISISISYWFFFVKALFLFFLFICASYQKQKLKLILWIMLILMFLDVAISLIMQKMLLIPYRLRSFDREGGANDFALMILCIMPIALHFMEHSDTKLKKYFCGGCFFAFLLALTRTRSRMGFLGLVLLMAQILWEKRKKPLVIIIVTVLVSIALANTHFRYFERIRSIDTEEAQSSRTKLWRQAIELIKIRPLYGVGPGNFIKAKLYYDIAGNKTHVVHNAFLEIGAENGLLMMATYILIFMVSLKQLFYAERYLSGKDEELRSISQAIRMSFLVLSVSMCFLSQQYNQFFFIFSALAARLKLYTDNEY